MKNNIITFFRFLLVCVGWISYLYTTLFKQKNKMENRILFDEIICAFFNADVLTDTMLEDSTIFFAKKGDDVVLDLSDDYFAEIQENRVKTVKHDDMIVRYAQNDY